MPFTGQTLYVIDDEAEIRAALTSLFNSVKMKVETFADADTFLAKMNGTEKGCIILDVRLPGISGLELLEQLQLQKNRLPVIMITGYGDVQMAVRAMKAGAVDFILKPFNQQCLLEVAQKWMTQSTQLNSVDELRERINSLSERELQILHLIVDGKLNKEIAFELSISISTVEAHRSHLMHKMQAKNIAELIRMYLQTQISNSC